MSELKEEKKSRTATAKVELPVVETVEREGLISGFILATAETTEGAIGSIFQVAQDVREEVFMGSVKTIELVESLQNSFTRVLKNSTQRFSEWTEQSLSTVESGSVGVVRLVREISQSATRLASETSQALTSRNVEVAVRPN